jgi:hypothetical protein
MPIRALILLAPDYPPVPADFPTATSTSIRRELRLAE